jgi:hypothetical protein
MLTQDKLKEILNYDQSTGIFNWKISPKKNINIGDIAGCNFRGYIVITIGNKKYRAHRLAFLYMNNDIPDCEIDHIDLNRSNNKFINLRLATTSENQCNVLIRKDNKTGYKGVSLNKYGTWTARATYKKVNYNLGTFKDIELANKAYQDFVKIHHGNFYRIPS